MRRYVCIHGHFYQPPRENPWLEAIEREESAHPYHDWNERIHAECYAANARSRILDERGQIARLTNNYARISFNFGPTLLAWLERHAEPTYRAILDADRASRERYGGHGSAIAQAYNHVILPLANHRDKRCQVVWGIRDFEHRFGRRPEGMWLPETAVDVETLEVLADAGIRFTILEPGQAARVRPRGSRRWRIVGTGGSLDPTMPYEMPLPSGASIALFFYDGPVSRAIAFERLLDSGAGLVQRLLERFAPRPGHPQLVHVATDGETYGHHHRFGDMALAWALDRIESGSEAELTNYGQFLERHPPTHVVEIRERTSWSCAHGVERWRSDCGCGSGARPGSSQAWRTPLRDALDALRDSTVEPYERAAGRLLRDPWAAREDYVRVILDRSAERKTEFLLRHARADPGPGERIAIWKLLELERQSMLSYTSCGWFFEDISGIETVQVMRYAARMVQLAREALGLDLEPELLAQLERARSNVPEHENGRRIWERLVLPSIVTPLRLAAHEAVRAVFPGENGGPYAPAWQVERHERDVGERAGARLATGVVRVRSIVTEEESALVFAAMRLGALEVEARVRPMAGERDPRAMLDEIGAAFAAGHLARTVGLVERHLGELVYGIEAVLPDARRSILRGMTDTTVAEIEAAMVALHDRHAPLMRRLRDLGQATPSELRTIGELVLGARLRQAFADVPIDVAEVRRLEAEARSEGLHLDGESLGVSLTKALDREASRLREAPADEGRLAALTAAIELARELPFSANLWNVENVVHGLQHDAAPAFAARARAGDSSAARWLERFRALAGLLRIRLDA